MGGREARKTDIAMGGLHYEIPGKRRNENNSESHTEFETIDRECSDRKVRKEKKKEKRTTEIIHNLTSSQLIIFNPLLRSFGVI